MIVTLEKPLEYYGEQYKAGDKFECDPGVARALVAQNYVTEQNFEQALQAPAPPQS